jgi:hypothetical protein
MPNKVAFLRFCIACTVLSLLGPLFNQPACANDSAVEITPSGLQFKSLKDVSIEKEELFISTDRVEVAYNFKNQSSTDIVTEVAFPIPEYKWTLLGRSVTDFADFTVEVDGKKNRFKREVKAFARGKDCTRILTDMNISIVDFGKYESGLDPVMKRPYVTFVDRLKPTDKKILIDSGILRAFIEAEPDVVFPDWSVSIKYYWTQRFPSRKTVTIRHSYGPYAGFRPFCASNSDDVEFLRKNACIDESFVSWMRNNGLSGDDCPMGLWVSYILTTANNWHGPIKDFRLTIEKKADQEVSTCFDPKIRKTKDNRYQSHVKDFIPEKDLKVYFFSRLGEIRR